ncbi:MAG TPA: carboxypeptidase-like regulatory domain-containing protein, partial [Symbiobacteriaceae bacterium]|nr:carboxypeptidase-like regulatory domain-containing protein [Symbiobacteriaceae bacterium]
VSVRVTENRKGAPPIAGAAVTVLAQDGSVAARGETDAQGRFDAVDLPEGSYTVRVTRDGFVAPKELIVKVTGGKEVAASFKLTAAP